MSEARKARFSFTKLIVDDEERMAAYYREVYGLNAIQRVQGESSAAGEPFREIIMGPGESISPEESLVMFKFTDRPAPRDQESILGFITEDLDALAGRAHRGERRQARRPGQVDARARHPRRVRH